jgi:hypothetical protein
VWVQEWQDDNENVVVAIDQGCIAGGGMVMAIGGGACPNVVWHERQ